MAIKCTCGKRMGCTQTRQSGEDVRRRYICECGAGATTKEVIIVRDVEKMPAVSPSRPRIKLLPVRAARRGTLVHAK